MADRPRWIIGGLLVLVGLVLLADNLDLFGAEAVWTYVPSLVVLWGLWSLVRHRLRRLFWPLLLVLVGVLWQLVELAYLTEAEAWSYWPAVLILLGLSLVFGWRRRSFTEVRGDHFEVLSVTGGLSERLSGSASNGEATAVFGNVSVDLSAVDPPIELEAAAVFGDVLVSIPEDWEVAIDAISIFGRVTDDREHTPSRKATPDLVVSGAAIFGDVIVTA